jgi:alkylation response protein AidB-like acyl-CoA dehydrogenase
MPQSSIDRAELLARVDAIEPLIVAHRSEAEAQGDLSASVVEALQRTELVNLFLPRSLGGVELDPVSCAQVVHAVARLDSCAGWFLMVANAARLSAATWPKSLVEELWSDDPYSVVAASSNKPMKAQRLDGGYRIEGQTSFASGCRFAQWFLTPAICSDTGADEWLAVVVPMSECEIVPNWSALGMRGTGSHDIRIATFVPARHTIVSVGIDAPRNEYYGGPLYRCSHRIVFATYVPVSLAVAELALEALSDLAQSKTPYAGDSKLKLRSFAQIKYGRALGIYRSAYGYFFDALDEAWQRAQRNEMPDRNERAALYLAGTHSVQACAEVVRLVAEAAGSSVIYTSGPFERLVRDMEVLRHHGFTNEQRFGSVAQVLWDAPLDYPVLLR